MKVSYEQFIEKFGQAKVKFLSYYKYSFTFSGQTEEGNKIHVTVGGSSDNIYKFVVDVNEFYTVVGMAIKSGVVELETGETVEYSGW